MSLITTVCVECGASPNESDSYKNSLFSTVREWMIEDFQVPDNTDSCPLEPSYVCLILRHHGKTLGYGSSETLSGAATTAFAEVSRNKIFSMNLTEELKNEIIDSISIELEYGGTPIPSAYKNIDRFDYTFNQGMRGIAVRSGGEWGIKMQAELRLSPFRTVSNIVESLCINLGIHPTIAFSHELPPDDDVTLYSIPLTTYIQNSAGAEIITLIRGDELVQNETLNTAYLTKLADTFASHLIKSINVNGMVIGGYQPETNTLTNMFATHFVQLLTANALQQYSKLSNASDSSTAVESSTAIIESIANDFKKDKNIDTESAAALIIILLDSTSKYSQNVQELLCACESQVMLAVDRCYDSSSAALPAFELSLVAAATIELGLHYEDEKLIASGEYLCSRCFSDVPLKTRASLIPWIITPILKLQQRGVTTFDDSLFELLQLAVSSQILSDDDGDLVGGFVLITDMGNVVDARGLRMLPMLAKICDYSSSNKTTAFKSLVLATRFVEQLATRKEKSERYENPAMALGGVRKSTWNAEMPTEATAMGLLGIVDAINTIQNIESSMK
ncbi:MAG: hypothetical protein ISR75_00795 [Phycisphaerales bacterium]|nr:hypothetical protein [Planctomycetota bacterium]MBL6996960.1 hypothetical protein [Phycisphaerales bacterium]